MKPKLEHYSLNFNVTQPNGHKIWNKTERVFVELTEYDKPKKNHDAAKQMILDKYPDCDIVFEHIVCYP